MTLPKSTRSILTPYAIPDSFLSVSADDECSVFLFTTRPPSLSPCIGSPLDSLTGYTPEEFHARGVKFWYSLIHPEDHSLVSDRIVEAHEALHTHYIDGRAAVPMILRYRLRHPGGMYLKIRDSRFFLSGGGNGVVDHVLFRIELIDQLESGSWLLENLRREKKCNNLLSAAVQQQERMTTPPKLSGREKEILRMIAGGMSTKMIARECSISINTVETHRRHLLQKLEVKNSMELIRKASELFLL
jgi:DNA-binding CsgD family transcriptional regulator